LEALSFSRLNSFFSLNRREISFRLLVILSRGIIKTSFFKHWRLVVDARRPPQLPKILFIAPSRLATTQAVDNRFT